VIPASAVDVLRNDRREGRRRFMGTIRSHHSPIRPISKGCHLICRATSWN
jgi:hypothetical protein